MPHKPTPKAIEDLLAKEPHREANSPNEHPCEGAEFHSPRPLRVHGYRLPNGKSFWLCGTCKDNIDTYVTLWEQTGGFSWSIQRCFGNNVRLVANMVIQSRRGEASHEDVPNLSAR
jgi:hypothetical protein